MSQTDGPTVPTLPDLIPVRMLNEYTYCPRLAYLEWVHGEWADNLETTEGSHDHRVVDEEDGTLPDADEMTSDGLTIHATAITLSDEQHGLISRLDLIIGDGESVQPVDYKHGKVPDNPERSWEPERVQLCAQGLILRANGYRCDGGVLYYMGSKTKVKVAFDYPLVNRTLQLLADMKEQMVRPDAPPPLDDSPKCPRCSLVGICLPDEALLLTALANQKGHGTIRRSVPARDDGVPLYVQTQGAWITKSGELLQVRKGDETLQEVRLMDLSQVSVFGGVNLSTPLIRELMAREIPICYFSYGGWFAGMTQGIGHKNVHLRQRQYATSADPEASLVLSKAFVTGKIRNARTLLRRNHPALPKAVLGELTRLTRKAETAPDLHTLLGVEGAAARLYFRHFSGLLKGPALEFDFDGRNRRPPRDPINALLSYLYSLLVKDVTVAVLATGFDPYLGMYHQPRYGRPALALDLMEEMRPLVADSVVLTAVNTGVVGPDDFIIRGGGVTLKDNARRSLLQAYERRLDTLVTHPVFGYSISYRRVLDVQARLLAKALLGEIPSYPSFCTR